MSATMVVAEDRTDVDPQVWTPAHLKRDQGRGEGPAGRPHLRQCGDQESVVPRGRQRPRLARQGAAVVGARLSLPRSPDLPADNPECTPQPARPADDGCGKELDHWFTEAMLHPKPSPPSAKPRPGLQHGRSARRLPPVLLAP
jgi:penicillin-insensitive murein endopeptidase